jgi:hypothetical protein
VVGGDLGDEGLDGSAPVGRLERPGGRKVVRVGVAGDVGVALGVGGDPPTLFETLAPDGADAAAKVGGEDDRGSLRVELESDGEHLVELSGFRQPGGLEETLGFASPPRDGFAFSSLVSSLSVSESTVKLMSAWSKRYREPGDGHTFNDRFSLFPFMDRRWIDSYPSIGLL